MQYKKLGHTDLNLPILGFGCMRFPASNKGQANSHLDLKIDEKQATEMIEYAIANGVNYFDTAYIYHSGNSEKFLGKALSSYDREKLIIADKMPFFFVNEEKDLERIFNEQLERLKTDYFDMYLMHGLGARAWNKAKNVNVFNFMEKIKKDGRAKYVGFSFHDSYDVFKSIIEDYDWDFTQIQYNYYDTQYQAGKKGLDYANNKGLGVVVMEPLRGGTLTNLPSDIENIFSSANRDRTPAEWALRWIFNQDGVSSVLSGMSTIEQLKENVEIANNFNYGSLTENEQEIIDNVVNAFRERIQVDCTHCGYCMPCPHNVNIPQCFSYYNDLFISDDKKAPRMRYNFMLAPDQKASACVQCGVCEEKCPQHIEIMNKLVIVKDEMEAGV